VPLVRTGHRRPAVDEEPLKPEGFKYERLAAGVRGGVMYPMRYCPWCGRPEKWRYQSYQNISPIAARAWTTGWTLPVVRRGRDWRDLIPRRCAGARLLVVSRIRTEYRVLLRPACRA